MASVEEVEAVLNRLVQRLGGLDPGMRSLLPARRTLQAECPDLGLVYHARWTDGRLGPLQPGPASRADIRVSVDSDDLIALSRGELDFGRAYATNRIRLDASMTDLLRLRAVL